MTGMLLSRPFMAAFGQQLNEVLERAKLTPDIVHLPEEPQGRLALADCERIEVAYMTRDWSHSPDNFYPKFADAMLAARNLQWVHFTSVGINQHRFVPPLMQRGVKFTTSAGANGEPVSQTAIAALLMLARGFPGWAASQRRRAWEPVRSSRSPADLRGQTVMVVGLGTIGTLVARFCENLGMNVIGIRRSPRRAGDTLKAIHTPAGVTALLPQCQWLIICCPDNKESHHMVNAEALAALPQGAGIINVSRGGIIDEPALIAALQSGHIRCAYLDVFEKEPLPLESPLWDMPNVIVTPHNAAVSAGNDRRSTEIFFANLEKWARGETMQNEQSPRVL